LPGGLKRGERVKDFQKISCRTHKVFAWKPKTKKIRSKESKLARRETRTIFVCRTHHFIRSETLKISH